MTSVSAIATDTMQNLVADAASDGRNVIGEDSMEPELDFFLSVGQYLRAYVVSTGDIRSSNGKARKRIELSINPSQANNGLEEAHLVVNSTIQAAVRSVEDHGLIMDLGLEEKGIHGFVSSKEVGRSLDHAKVKEGAVFLCLILGVSSNGKTIKLSANPLRLGNIKKTNFLANAPTINSFLPGTAVEFLVSETHSSALSGKVMGLLDVTADLIHSGSGAGGKPLDKKYLVGSKIKGRIICTFPAASTRKLGISLLDHVLSLCSRTTEGPQTTEGPDRTVFPTQAIPLSTIINEARVAKIEPCVGLFLDIGAKGVRGFVHISQVADGKTEVLSESTGFYKLGSVHRARVVDYNSMDGLYIVSMEQRILDLPFLRLEDIQIGQIVQGSVEKLIINASGFVGVLIKLTEGISAMASELHLADIYLQHPERKFREGQAVTARVLSIDLEKRRARLTLKKSLVNSESTVWRSYDDIKVGASAPGTLVNVSVSGAVVQFYGLVRGFLPISQMSETYIEDPSQHFRVGQVVNVHVLSVDPSAERMTVSCRDQCSFDASQQKAFIELSPGLQIGGTVTEKTKDAVVLELAESRLKGILPFEHLADGSSEKCLSVARKIRIGQALRDLIVLNKDETKHLIKLTGKPKLVKAAKTGTLLKNFDSVILGAEVTGFVRNITPGGVFVEFAGGIKAFLRKINLSKEAVELPDFGLRRNQSISATVISLDESQHLFHLTQKPSAIDAIRNPEIPHDSTEVLSNSIDKVSKSINDFTVGKLTKAKIVSVKATQLNVQLADKVQGRIDVSEIYDSWEDIEDPKHPLKKFHKNEIISARILGMHDSRNHKFLPITHKNKSQVFELSAKISKRADANSDTLSFDKIKPNSVWLTFVNNLADNCIWVSLSPNVRGRISAIDISDDVSLLADPEKNFPVGSALRARVTNVDTTNNRLDLSARLDASSSPSTFDDLVQDMVLSGRVTKVTERLIMIQISHMLSAPVHLVDMADDYADASLTKYEKDQIIQVCVIKVDTPNKKFYLSTRPSRISSSPVSVLDSEITSMSRLKVNDLVRGFIKNVTESGIFINLGNDITAYVRVADLSDSFIKDWKSDFRVDQLVKGKVIAVDPSIQHVQMSLKRSALDNDYKPPLTYIDIQIGQIVTAKVRKVEEYGVFIVVDNSANVSGLCHRSEIADEPVTDIVNLFNEGDIVKAKVLKLDLEKRRLSFGLKASYFDDEEATDDETHELEFMNKASNPHKGDDWDIDNVKDDDLGDVRHNDHETELHPQGQLVEDLEDDIGLSLGVQPLDVGEFDWTGNVEFGDSDDVKSDADREAIRPIKKKKKKTEIKIDQTGDLDVHEPQSAADFERLLMGQPNASYLWLTYMAFHLERGEVKVARDIVERAIRTIRQDSDTDAEAMNVWIASLNLENTYGNDESLEAVFRRACTYNDAEEIHTRLASIYIQSEKTEVWCTGSRSLK